MSEFDEAPKEVGIETRHSTEFKDFAAAMAKAQGVVETADKSRLNPHFKQKYADLADVVAACQAALSKNGIARLQVPCYDGDKVWLETWLVHDSGQWFMGRYPISAPLNNVQQLVAAFTYARRTSLASMVGVVSQDEDDDGEFSGDGDSGDTPQGTDRPASDERTKGEQWAKAAERHVASKITTLDALQAWKTKFDGTLAKLEAVAPGAYTSLMDVVTKRYGELSSE